MKVMTSLFIMPKLVVVVTVEIRMHGIQQDFVLIMDRPLTRAALPKMGVWDPCQEVWFSGCRVWFRPLWTGWSK
jgi:hypothetical protein